MLFAIPGEDEGRAGGGPAALYQISELGSMFLEACSERVLCEPSLQAEREVLLDNKV